MKLTPASAITGGSAGYDLVTSVELEHRRRALMSPGTTTRWPAARPAAADLHEAVGVVEQPELDRHQVMDAAGADLLERIAAAREREQRVDGHHERILDAGGRDRDVDGRLVEVAGRGRVGRGDVDLDRRRARAAAAPALVARRRRRDACRRSVTCPGVVRLSGSVIVTGSPTLTSACCAASSSIVTCRDGRGDREHRPGLHRRTERRRHARHAHRARLEHDRAEQQLARSGSGRVPTGRRLIAAAVAAVNAVARRGPCRSRARSGWHSARPHHDPADIPGANARHGATEP